MPRDLVVVAAPAEAIGDGDAAAIVCGAAQPLGGVCDERLPLILERAAVGVEEGEALHLVGAGIADGVGCRELGVGVGVGAGSGSGAGLGLGDGAWA